MKRRHVKTMVYPWKLLSLERPKIVGFYWIAGFWRPDDSVDSYSFSPEPEEPQITELSEDYISGQTPIESWLGYKKEMTIWSGPIPMPQFENPVRDEENEEWGCHS